MAIGLQQLYCVYVFKVGVHLQLVRTVYMWLEELEGVPLLISCSMLQTAALLSDLTQNLYQSISINTGYWSCIGIIMAPGYGGAHDFCVQKHVCVQMPPTYMYLLTIISIVYMQYLM